MWPPFLLLSAPPSAPANINVTVATESFVVVTWSRPRYDGGRTDLSYDLQCNICSNVGFCSSDCSGVKFWPSAKDLGTTQVTISNLDPATLYNITVISKNGVSKQAGSSSVRYSHKTFSLTTPTTRNPESSTTLVTVTDSTTTQEIPSHENTTTLAVVTGSTTTEEPPSHDITATVGGMWLENICQIAFKSCYNDFELTTMVGC